MAQELLVSETAENRVFQVFCIWIVSKSAFNYRLKIKIQISKEEPVFSIDRQKMCIVYTPIFQRVMRVDSVVVILRKHTKK